MIDKAHWETLTDTVSNRLTSPVFTLFTIYEKQTSHVTAIENAFLDLIARNRSTGSRVYRRICEEVLAGMFFFIDGEMW